jgi:Domain of unknown function (DUF4129)
MVIAAGVGSGSDRADDLASHRLSLAVSLLAGGAMVGGVLFVVLSGWCSAVAGSTRRGTALLLGIAIIVLAGVATILLLPRSEPGASSLISAGPGTGCINGEFWWLHFPSRREELFTHPERFCWPSGGVKVVGVSGGGGPEIPVTLVAVAGGGVVALIIAAAMAIVMRRSRRRASAPVAEEDAVVLAVDESLEDLRRERDVRRAIVACYARMERAFARAGRGRRAHETPLEFLRRVLERVAHEPGQVLTELFERARFSVEPMGESEKRSAIAALEALRARVAG